MCLDVTTGKRRSQSVNHLILCLFHRAGESVLLEELLLCIAHY